MEKHEIARWGVSDDAGNCKGPSDCLPKDHRETDLKKKEPTSTTEKVLERINKRNSKPRFGRSERHEKKIKKEEIRLRRRIRKKALIWGTSRTLEKWVTWIK